MRTLRSVRGAFVALVVASATFGASGVIGGPASADAVIGSAQVSQLQSEVDDCPELTDTIVRLYSATFLRTPDDAGLGYWADEWRSGDIELPEISEFFTQSPEFQSLYGDVESREFVELLYENVLGRPGEREGVDYWTDRLATDSRGTITLLFSESPEYVERTGTALPLTGFFSWPDPAFDFGCRRPLTPELLILSDSVIGAMSESTSGAINTVGPRLVGEWDIVYDGQDGTWQTNGGARNRPTVAGPNLLRRYSEKLDGVVVLGLGYNDAATPGFEPAMDEMLNQTADSDLVVLVTLRESGRYGEYYGAANDYMFRQAAVRSNVVVADWAAVSMAHPESVKRDGIHLTTTGAFLMADLLVETILDAE